MELLVIICPSSCQSFLSLPSADRYVCAKDRAMEMSWRLNVTPVYFLQQSTVSCIGTLEGMGRHEGKEIIKIIFVTQENMLYCSVCGERGRGTASQSGGMGQPSDQAGPVLCSLAHSWPGKF